MATDSNDIESNYKKIVNSLYQYLDDGIKDFGSLKPEICNILKTHRPIKKFDYEYGISKSLKGKSLLIVREFNDRSMVREYFKSGKNSWQCCECNRTATSSESNESIIDLLIQHGIVFVKSEHNCKPRQFEFVKQIQKLYKEKKIDEAVSLQKSVLGSEDSYTNQSGVGKLKKSACSSKKLIDEVILLYDKMKDSDNQITDVHFGENCEQLSREEAFARLMINLEEYTNEKSEAVLSNKSRILCVLKKNRPIRICDYQYGFMTNLRKDRRLTVFEWNNRGKVRVYSNRSYDNGLWDCLECYRVCRQKITSTTHLHLLNGIVFVPFIHECPARDYKLIMIHQKFLEDKETSKARSMALKISFVYGQNIANLNTLDKISAPKGATSTGKIDAKNEESNSKISKGLKRKLISDDENDNTIIGEKLSVHKKSKLNKSALDDTVMNEDNSVIIEENEEPPVLKKSKLKKNKKMRANGEADRSIHQKSETHFEVEKENPTTATFAFENPSVSKLKEICAKLNIHYRNNAVKFWENITLDKIDTVFAPTLILRHRFQSQNFYEILSKLFIGKLNYHEQIKTTISDSFREQLVSSGGMSSKKFNKLYLDTVTEEHLSFISKFLSCQIWIFDGEKGIRKYGKWKHPESKRLTLILYFVDGFYSVVFSF